MIPLSFAQRRMWLLHQLEGGSENWNMPAAFRLTGPLDHTALTEAIRDVVDRHEILRTVYGTTGDGELHQRILPTAEGAPDVPLTEIAPDDVAAAVAEAVAHRFDLAAEPPVRVKLFRCSPEEHVLVLVVHHIATDGASGAPLARDLATAYTARRDGRAPRWDPLPVQYKDYTMWQREVLGDVTDPESLAATQIRYWRAELADVPQPLNLPLDRPRPTTPTGRGATVDLEVDPEVTAALQRLADERGATLSMVLHTALAVLLRQLGGGDDVTIGGSIAGRTDEALADLVGFFVNTQVLRVGLSGDLACTELLARVRDKALAAYEHQDVPFDLLVEAINPVRSTAYQPLFQVMLGLQNYTRPELELPGLTLTVEPLAPTAAKVDLFLNLTADGSGALRGDILYATDLFDRETVEAFAARFVLVLTRIAAEPALRVGDIDILLPGERRRLLEDANDTAEPTPGHGPAEAVRDRARTDPESIAVIAGEDTLTYRELDTRSNRLAHWLADRGVGAETRVAVPLTGTTGQMVALLAVAKAGGTAVPLDPDGPPRRTTALLRDADPGHVLDADTLDGADLTHCPDTAPRTAARPGNAHYISYVPGPDGTPRGVVITRGAVTNLLATAARRFPLAPGDRMLFGTTTAHDCPEAELFLPLLTGATVVLTGRHTLADPAAAAALIRRHRITAVRSAPAFWRTLLRHEPHAAKDLRIVIGDGIPRAGQARTLTKQAAEVLQVYGPAETAGWCAGARLTVGAGTPVGAPAGNTRVYVLDARLRPVPRGVPGELYVAGAGTGRGYHGLPGPTSERFPACPFGPPGGRMYRTGDLVRWDSSGRLEHLGRTDRQRRIRGCRVEPGEIERALTGHPGVADAVAVVREDRDGAGRVVAYVVPGPDAGRDAGADAGSDGGPHAGADTVRAGALLDGLPAHLREHLPEAMLPTALIPLPVLPRTPDGALDPDALPADETATGTGAGAGAGAGSGRGPRNSHEEKMCALFRELLAVESVGIDDDFFELGGHSLLATRLSARIRDEFELDLPLRTIIKYPTVAELAALMLITTPEQLSDPFGVVLPLNNDPGTGREPLWFLHGGGGLGWAFFSFVLHVRDRPAYALQSRGWNGTDALAASVPEMIEDYVDEMVKIQPEGPFHLVGWSYGGTVVQAVAEAIDRRGREISFVAVLDSQPGGEYFKKIHTGRKVSDYREELEEHFGEYMGTENRKQLVDTMSRILANNAAIMSDFESPVYRGDVLFFNATLEENTYAHLWRPYVLGTIEVHDVRAVHHELHMPGPVAEIMAVINRKLAG